MEARAKASEKGKMKDTMERAKLKSELDNLQRLVDRIPPDILAELNGSSGTRQRKGDRYKQKFSPPLCGIVP